jgi:hypothetical protein
VFGKGNVFVRALRQLLADRRDKLQRPVVEVFSMQKRKPDMMSVQSYPIDLY